MVATSESPDRIPADEATEAGPEDVSAETAPLPDDRPMAAAEEAPPVGEPETNTTEGSAALTENEPPAPSPVESAEAEPADAAEVTEPVGMSEATPVEPAGEPDAEPMRAEAAADEPQSAAEPVAEPAEVPAGPVPVEAPAPNPVILEAPAEPPPEPPQPADITPAADLAEAAADEAEPAAEDAAPAPPPDRPDYKWYILQTYSGYENRVKRTLEERLRIEGMAELVEEIFVPGEDVTRVKAGRKRKLHVVYFPGYVLIKMKLTDELWHLLMNIPRVSGFVGGTNRDPQPLDPEELQKIHAQMDEGITTTTLAQEFDVGQQVVVIDGPFANFGGKIDEVNNEKRKVRVLISILGRSTPVELDFDKIKAQTE